MAVAVLAHDFSDGINTVNVMVRHGGSRAEALRWLLVDALGLLLALFAGFFLYIGASDLIPENHHQHPKFLTTFITLLGAAVLYIAIHFAV